MKAKYNFFKNGSYAIYGIKALMGETSFKLWLSGSIPLAIISLFFDVSLVEHILLISVLLLILSAEAFNTAIESTVDLVTLEWHALAKRAKDCASAGVFFCLLIGIVTWISILIF